jgi:hypothetical protein
MLARKPYEKDMTLEAFANELDMDSEAMKKLINRHLRTKG